ncbi:D-Ala-D-Ala carboxypeptidase family metallohydrolase [Falsiroseomonas sp.]|uniref:D-Ala-D-Ala carboxypeptidase family metallohydrolase n=1 Tax=Falsiroseomonas sp. TaxID=2870721 RepID=UPI0027209602|nr:D-Ala-D-Ala carboxypeptidase family metallohydrolase [Falsiroseomonas sp.]MDO9500612.1 D-Ala-D-Ala carboxypeptidase family metallohydrolase [Falsiroseomonas sp.]
MRHFAHWRAVPASLWPWPDFSPAEIASRGDGSLLLVPEALDRLQAARTRIGRPFVIHSAYRDPVHNARVGGAPLSRHKTGDAFDIALAGHDRAALLAACRAAGFRGFGFYSRFLHVDLGPERNWGLWTS